MLMLSLTWNGRVASTSFSSVIGLSPRQKRDNKAKTQGVVGIIGLVLRVTAWSFRQPHAGAPCDRCAAGIYPGAGKLSKRNTTSSFPARQYSGNGERRSFTLLHPALDYRENQERIKTLILEEDPKLKTAVFQVVR